MWRVSAEQGDYVSVLIICHVGRLIASLSPCKAVKTDVLRIHFVTENNQVITIAASSDGTYNVEGKYSTERVDHKYNNNLANVGIQRTLYSIKNKNNAG